MKNFQQVFYHDESVFSVLFLPEMCTKISTKKILMPEDFLPLVAKQGQTRTVQGHTNKYLEVRGNTHLITYIVSIPIYIYVCVLFFVYFRKSVFLPLLDTKTCIPSGLIFL